VREADPEPQPNFEPEQFERNCCTRLVGETYAPNNTPRTIHTARISFGGTIIGAKRSTGFGLTSVQRSLAGNSPPYSNGSPSTKGGGLRTITLGTRYRGLRSVLHRHLRSSWATREYRMRVTIRLASASLVILRIPREHRCARRSPDTVTGPFPLALKMLHSRQCHSILTPLGKSPRSGQKTKRGLELG
jgi:hypothetical protein